MDGGGSNSSSSTRHRDHDDDDKEWKVGRIERLLREALSVLRRSQKEEEAAASCHHGDDDRDVHHDCDHEAEGPMGSDDDDDVYLSRCARFVVDSMTTPGRVYHDVYHVFQVMDNFLSNKGARLHSHDPPPGETEQEGKSVRRQDQYDAIGILAAVFHDVIYLSVDGNRLSPDQLQVLHPYVVLDAERRDEGMIEDQSGTDDCPPSSTSKTWLTLQYTRPSSSRSSSPLQSCQDRCVDLTARMFGLVPQSKEGANVVSVMLDDHPRFQQQGVKNEFLSALAAVQLLGPKVRMIHLFQLVACIEASIPFRRGRSPPPSPPPPSCVDEEYPDEEGEDDDATSNPSPLHLHHHHDSRYGFSTSIMVELHERWRQVLGLSAARQMQPLMLLLPGRDLDGNHRLEEDESEEVAARMRQRFVFGEQEGGGDDDGKIERALVQAVRLAADFANADVGSFGAADPRTFLDSTWRLLPEWYPRLLPLSRGDGWCFRHDSGSFPLALHPHKEEEEEATGHDMEGALVGLLERYPRIDANCIFQSFRDSLPDEAWTDWRDAAVRNLDCVGKYARVRLATLRLVRDILEVIGERTRHRRRVASGGCSSYSVRPFTLSLIREAESGVPSKDLPSHMRDGLDSRLWSCLSTTRPDSGACSAPPSSWGDAVATRASALVYSSVSWEGIEVLSAPPTVVPSRVGAGEMIRRHVKDSRSRRLLVDSVWTAAIEVPEDPQNLATAASDQRGAVYEALECAV